MFAVSIYDVSQNVDNLIVDSEAYIQRLLPFLDEVIEDGMVTMEKVRILHYHTRHEMR